MRLSSLIQDLEEALSCHGDLEVVAAYQPHYPLAGTVDAVTVDRRDDVVWIAVGGSPQDLSPYAPRAAWSGDIIERKD